MARKSNPLSSAIVIIAVIIGGLYGYHNSTKKKGEEKKYLTELKKIHREMMMEIKTNPDVNLDKYFKKMDDLTKGMEGSEYDEFKLGGVALQATIRHARNTQGDFEKCIDKINSKEWLDPSGLVNKRTYKAEKDVYAQLIKSCDKALKGLNTTEAEVRKAVNAVPGVSSSMKSSFLSGFCSAAKRSSKQNITLYRYWKDYGIACHKYLEILEQQAGNWELDTDGTILFDSDQVTVRFNKVCSEIDRIAAKVQQQADKVLKNMEQSINKL